MLAYPEPAIVLIQTHFYYPYQFHGAPISSAYTVNLDRRMLDKILYVADKKWYACTITTVCFITLLTNRYNEKINTANLNPFWVTHGRTLLFIE